MSSDSSDDEELAKLREAVDPQFITNGVFMNKNTSNSLKKDSTILVSLRQTKDEDEQFNLFHVSPEFRNYVAKHLSTILDKILEKKLNYKETKYENDIKPKRRKGGIKLFRTSPHFVKLEIKLPQILPKKIIKEKNIDEDQLRLVAVSPEDILNQKETKHWSNRSKAPVYTYIETKQGLILK